MCFSVQIDQNLKQLGALYNASINDKAYDYFTKMQLEKPSSYKPVDVDGRLYTKLWAPVIIHHKTQNEIRPMRYQLLPSFCDKDKYTRLNPKTNRHVEIKSTYNARVESLLERKAWSKPFGTQHAILCVESFYEWVDINGEKQVLEFKAKNSEHLNLACLFDTWYSSDREQIIQSFAIITRNPEPEVLAAGHDRTPVNLKAEYINDWLNPKNQSSKQLLSMLNDPRRPEYIHTPV